VLDLRAAYWTGEGQTAHQPLWLPIKNDRLDLAQSAKSLHCATDKLCRASCKVRVRVHLYSDGPKATQPWFHLNRSCSQRGRFSFGHIPATSPVKAPRRALYGTRFLYHAIGYLLRFAHVIRADLYDFARDDIADGIVTID
jgi:hypothetical protein